MLSKYRVALSGIGAVQQHWACAVIKEFANNCHAMIRCFPGGIHRLGHALAKCAMVIDQCGTIGRRGKWETTQTVHRSIGGHRAGLDPLDEVAKTLLVHPDIVA